MVAFPCYQKVHLTIFFLRVFLNLLLGFIVIKRISAVRWSTFSGVKACWFGSEKNPLLSFLFAEILRYIVFHKFLLHEAEDFLRIHRLKCQWVFFFWDHNFVSIRQVVSFPRSGWLYFDSSHKHSINIGSLVIYVIENFIRFSDLFFCWEDVGHRIFNDGDKSYFNVLAYLWFRGYYLNDCLKFLDVNLLVFLCKKFTHWYEFSVLSYHIKKYNSAFVIQ